MSSRASASSSIAPMSTEPSQDRSAMTFRMPNSSEDSKTMPNPRESYRKRESSQAKTQFKDEKSMRCSFLPDTNSSRIL